MHGRYQMPPQPPGEGLFGSGYLTGVELFVNQVSTVPFDYPGVAYGVLSWWDYGHWLQVIGQRMVVAQPFQAGIGGRRGAVTDEMMPGAAPFFVAETEAAATQVLYDIDPREGKWGARFIVTDIRMASGLGIFGAMAAWTLDTENYWISVPTGGGQSITIIGTERYFDSMVFRLHMLDANGLEQYRLVYESLIERGDPNLNLDLIRWHLPTQELFYKTLFNQIFDQDVPVTNSGHVKVFEFVEGAVITGSAAPNETVELSLTLRTNRHRTIVYSQTTVADASGAFSFRVPHSTTGPIQGETNFAVRAVGQYTITTSAGEISFDVSERDVLDGNTIRV